MILRPAECRDHTHGHAADQDVRLEDPVEQQSEASEISALERRLERVELPWLKAGMAAQARLAGIGAQHDHNGIRAGHATGRGNHGVEAQLLL